MTKAINSSIGWIDGKWGETNKLGIPICDRGLNLGDGIFETILITQGVPKLLTSHLKRMQESASILKMDALPSESWLRSLIAEGISHASLTGNNGILRLNWSRGNNFGRGINIPNRTSAKSNHRFWLEISHGEPYFESISSTISRHERRNPYSRLSTCKTFNYSQSIQARIEAKLTGFDEALLLSTDGEICCGSTSNLIIFRQNQWITPRLESGCLPGIMRQQGLNSGRIKEAKIHQHPEKGDQWLLINSLSCRPIYAIGKHSLEIFPNPKKLWLSLINSQDKNTEES